MNDRDYPLYEEFAPKFRLLPERVFSVADKKISEQDLSKEQTRVLDGMSKRLGESKLSLVGFAGSGKSTLIPLLAQRTDNMLRVAFCSFTGKAANVLKRKLEAAGIPSQDIGYVGTIHGLMYSPIVDSRGIVQNWAKKPRLLNRNEQLLDMIFVDEASMVNRRLFEDLSSYDVPVVLVGDGFQLPPVDGDSILENPDFLLREVHRQAADNPIIQLSMAIRQFGSIPKDLEESEEIRKISMKDLGGILNEGFESLGLDMGLLVRSNKKRCTFNQQAVSKRKQPAVGDIVICLKNNPPVFNGMRGTVTQSEQVYEHWYRLTVEFTDDGLEVTTLVNKHQFHHPETIQGIYHLYDEFKYPRKVSDTGMFFDFGMALTVHKAQGSAFERVVLCPEYWPSIDQKNPDLYSRWLYTGVTRAAKTLYLLQ